MTGVLNFVRKISSVTYIRGANIAGVAIMFGAITVLIIAAGQYDVPIREVLLASPGVFAGVAAIWYNMLNSPDPMILLINVIPTDDDGSHVAADKYYYQSLDDSVFRINPRQKDTPNNPISSFTTPWVVESENNASDAIISFDITNRGYKQVILHEYRIEGENIKRTIAPISSKEHFSGSISANARREPTDGSNNNTITERKQVRPSERLSEQLRLSELVHGDIWVQDRIEFKLELYAGSGAPVDSVIVEINPIQQGMAIEWMTHRSRFHMFLRRVLPASDSQQ